MKNHFGEFDPEVLQVLKDAYSQDANSFAESCDDTFDFKTCKRTDGSVYGVPDGSSCAQKGAKEVQAAEKKYGRKGYFKGTESHAQNYLKQNGYRGNDGKNGGTGLYHGTRVMEYINSAVDARKQGDFKSAAALIDQGRVEAKLARESFSRMRDNPRGKANFLQKLAKDEKNLTTHTKFLDKKLGRSAPAPQATTKSSSTLNDLGQSMVNSMFDDMQSGMNAAMANPSNVLDNYGRSVNRWPDGGYRTRKEHYSPVIRHNTYEDAMAHIRRNPGVNHGFLQP